MRGMRAALRLAVLGAALALAAPAGSAGLPSGTIAFTVDPRTVFVLALPAGTTSVARTPEDVVGHAVLSPDGQRIAFAGPTGVWIMRRDGSRATRIRRITASELAWSPGARYLAFVHDGAVDTMRADGSQLRRVATHAGSPDWWADGNGLVVVRRPDPASGNGPIYAVRTDGTGLQRLQAGSWASPHMSPDGRRLLVSRGGGQGVFVAPSPGSLPRRVIHDGSEPQWSPDSRWVGFLRVLEGATSRIFVEPARGGSAQPYGPVIFGSGGFSWSR